MSNHPSQLTPALQKNVGNWMPAAEEENSKFDFWGLVNRQKWLIFLGMLAGIGGGLIYYYNTSPTYESVAEISIEVRNNTTPLVTNGESPLPLASEIAIRHDKYIDSVDFIYATLQKKRYFKLDSFANLTELDSAREVEENLEVQTGSRRAKEVYTFLPGKG